MTEDDRLWEEYFIPGTNILKNKLGLINKEELAQMEKDITFEKLVELYLNPVEGNFDPEHLCLIHKYLFEDIYPFAGQYRNVEMRKKTTFVSPHDIERNLKIVFQEMWEDFSVAHSKSDYAIFLAEMFSAIMKVHPFREGNGRTIREFTREFVEKHIPNYSLKWSLVDKEQLDLGIEYSSFTKTYLIMEFEKALIPREKENEFPTR